MRKNESTNTLRKDEHITLSSPSLSPLRCAVALIFRFSHLNKTVRCCRVIVPLFAPSHRRALAHTHTYPHRRRLLCFSYKQIYIFYEETHHIFRVVTHNNNQTDQEKRKKSDGTRHYSEERERCCCCC